MKPIQINKKSTVKIHTSLWILKISRKQSAKHNVCDFQKENHTLGYKIKNL
jgi:hypothetical protein